MSFQLKGNIVNFLDCLGLPEDNNRIFSLINAPFVKKEICYIQPQTFYFFYSAGCELSFNHNKILESIFIYVKPQNKFHSFKLNDFINGINQNSSREDVVNIMKLMIGNPERINTTKSIALGYEVYHYIRYFINNKFIHFEYLQDLKLNTITLFCESS